MSAAETASPPPVATATAPSLSNNDVIDALGAVTVIVPVLIARPAGVPPPAMIVFAFNASVPAFASVPFVAVESQPVLEIESVPLFVSVRPPVTVFVAVVVSVRVLPAGTVVVVAVPVCVPPLQVPPFASVRVPVPVMVPPDCVNAPAVSAW
jgi:hypothetical protein